MFALSMDATRDNRRKRTFFGKRIEDETALIFPPPEEEGEGETTVATALPPLSPFPPTPREFHVSVRTAERGEDAPIIGGGGRVQKPTLASPSSPSMLLADI